MSEQYYSKKIGIIISISIVTVIILIIITVINSMKTSQLESKIDKLTIQNEYKKSNSISEISADRFRIYFSPHLQKSTFLIDNKEGLIYTLYVDPKSDEFWWKKSYIDGNIKSISIPYEYKNNTR